MELDPETMKQLYEVFRSELEEQSHIITSNLLSLEGHSLADGPEVKTKIDAIFRAAHTIKGSSRSISLTKIGEVAHSLENIFSIFKTNDVIFSKPIIDICLESMDALKKTMEAVQQGGYEKIDLSPLQERLNTFLTPSSGSLAPSSRDDGAHVKNPSIDISHESMRVDTRRLEKISSLMDELNVIRIEINDSKSNMNAVVHFDEELNSRWFKLSETISTMTNYAVPESVQKLFTEYKDTLLELAAGISKQQKTVRNSVNELNIICGMMKDEIAMLRLVPASTLFNSIPRYVRDLSQELNKQVEFSIIGDQVRMDRMVLEGLKNSIIHLVRNAIDHGIESPKEREKNGKSPAGKIQIEIIDKGTQIVIKISDDGNGINLEKVKKLALKKGMLTEEEINRLTASDVMEFIFQPGFSTSETVSDVSGRGVGLDIVRVNIAQMNGSVIVETAEGKGTTFIISLPLTLSSERGLFVETADSSFVIPCHAVERILTLHKSEVMDVAGTQVVLVDEVPIQLHLLASLLELNAALSTMNDMIKVILIKKNMTRVGLLVEDVIGEREIVIKKLLPPMEKLPCVSGGTLSDGNNVIIVLNPHDLIYKALKGKTGEKIKFVEKKVKSITKPMVLVVDDSITTRTLQKNILENNNYAVTVAVNGKEAWEKLQRVNYAIVITDINMPIMDGYELTEKIKQHDKYKHIPVIMVTSRDSVEEKKKGLDVGANAYIVKSEFESGALLDVISQLV